MPSWDRSGRCAGARSERGEGPPPPIPRPGNGPATARDGGRGAQYRPSLSFTGQVCPSVLLGAVRFVPYTVMVESRFRDAVKAILVTAAPMRTASFRVAQVMRELATARETAAARYRHMARDGGPNSVGYLQHAAQLDLSAARARRFAEREQVQMSECRRPRPVDSPSPLSRRIVALTPALNERPLRCSAGHCAVGARARTAGGSMIRAGACRWCADPHPRRAWAGDCAGEDRCPLLRRFYWFVDVDGSES